jgi:uncharacterized protein YndB with AHSA1/START domain
MKAKHALIHDTFTLERRYPSAPAKVYRYFSEVEYRKRWFGGDEGWSQRSHSLDFRVGGQELAHGAPPGGPVITYDSRILDIVPGERIINSYVLAAAGERFSVSLSTVELLPDGTGTLMRVTEHGAYFDGNPESPQIRAHGIGKQLDLLGQVLQNDQH